MYIDQAICVNAYRLHVSLNHSYVWSRRQLELCQRTALWLPEVAATEPLSHLIQDANDFINFSHNAINNMQMPADKAQTQCQYQVQVQFKLAPA